MPTKTVTTRRLKQPPANPSNQPGNPSLLLGGAPESLLLKPFNRLLGLSLIDQLYQQTRGRIKGAETETANGHSDNQQGQPDPIYQQFLNEALKTLDSRCTLHGATEQIPAQGPLVIVANHPFGGIEGMLLAQQLLSHRTDLKVIANGMLGRICELNELMIHVSLFGNRRGKAANGAAMLSARRWLDQGHALLVFPAGEVSQFRWRHRQVVDATWHPSIARLISSSSAAVTPIYLHGRNSIGFQVAANLSPWLRLLLLAREFLKARGRTINAVVGETLSPKRLTSFNNNDRLITYLRLCCYGLRSKPLTDQYERSMLAKADRQQQFVDELAALPAAQKLLQSGDYSVYYACHEQIPTLLQEIGLQRELTFRGVGEGSGNQCDLDHFDQTYLQLILWDHQNLRLAGGYRLGLSDQLLAQSGSDGLYTASLFRYRKSFLQHLSPAIELGRSFITPDYQKSYAPLLLLWQGIGRFVAAHPRYRYLFGPVSISNDYSNHSRQLIARFLQRSFPSDASSQVRGNYRSRLPRGLGIPTSQLDGLLVDIDELDQLISRIEPTGHGIPVLLRQYLKLNARVLAFNQDRKFSDVLDVLITVDLLESDQKLLKRYMGGDGLQRFLSHHQPEPRQGVA